MKTNINWKQKLSSRKFWIAIIGFLTPMLLLFKVANSDIEAVTSIIMAGATLIAYILSEGFIDGKREESNTYSEHYEIEVEEDCDDII